MGTASSATLSQGYSVIDTVYRLESGLQKEALPRTIKNLTHYPCVDGLRLRGINLGRGVFDRVHFSNQFKREIKSGNQGEHPKKGRA